MAAIWRKIKFNMERNVRTIESRCFLRITVLIIVFRGFFAVLVFSRPRRIERYPLNILNLNSSIKNSENY